MSWVRVTGSPSQTLPEIPVVPSFFPVSCISANKRIQRSDWEFKNQINHTQHRIYIHLPGPCPSLQSFLTSITFLSAQEYGIISLPAPPHDKSPAPSPLLCHFFQRWQYAPCLVKKWTAVPRNEIGCKCSHTCFCHPDDLKDSLSLYWTLPTALWDFFPPSSQFLSSPNLRTNKLGAY